MFVLFYDAKVSGSLYAMPNRITDSSTTFTESAAFFVTSQGMGKVLNVQSVNDYARFVGAPQLHPLVSIIHYDELEHCRHSLNQYGVYGLFLMEESPYTINYGNARVQMQGGTLMGVAPGQAGGVVWAIRADSDIIAGISCLVLGIALAVLGRGDENPFNTAGKGVVIGIVLFFHILSNFYPDIPFLIRADFV